MLKPNIVYFGENVPKDRVAQAYAMVDDADALLVAGSSLTVFSGFRFVRHAVALGVPVAIINRGRTRGDELATVKIDTGCSPMLALLADELPIVMQRMNTPNPLALLNRLRPKSCPAEERWSLSIGDLIADVVNAPGPVRSAVGLLNHFGGVAISAQSVEFDGDDVDWSDVTDIRTRNLVGYLLSDAIDKQVGKLPLPRFPGRGLLIDAIGSAVLTALVAVAGKQLEEGPLDIRIPAEVHYRGVLRGKELSPGVLAALRAGRSGGARVPAGDGPHTRRRRAASDDDPVDAAAHRADRIKSAIAKLTS